MVMKRLPVWKGSTQITEGTERGMRCQEATDLEGGQEKDRLCVISDLKSHFRVALGCSLFCRGVEFESKYKTHVLVSLGGGGLAAGELQRNVCS